MNRKSKLLFSIMSLCFSVAVLCFGVYSAVSVNYSVSGSLSYTVEDVFVDIETTLYMSTEDYNTAKSNISTNITTLETNLPNTTPSNMYKTTYRDPHSTYNNGNVNTEDTITFNNEDNELPINYGAYSQGNTAYAYYIVIAITNHGQDIVNAQIDLGDTSTLNSIVDTNASYVNIQGKTETVTTTEYIIIAMALDNAVQSVNQSFNFNITIGMGEFVAEEITDMLFTFDEQNKTASLLSYTGTNTVVDIPERVGAILSDTKTMHFADVNEIMALTSSEVDMFHLFRFANITSSLGNAGNQLLFSWVSESENASAKNITVEFPSQCEISYDFYVQNMLPLGEMGGAGLLAPAYELAFGFVNSLTLEVDGEIVEPNPSAIIDAMSGNISEGYFNKLISIGSATTQEELSQYQSYFPIKYTNITYSTAVVGNNYVVSGIFEDVQVFPQSVEQINLPSTLTNIGNGAFEGTTWLDNITTNSNGIATAKDGQTKYYIKAPNTTITSVDLSGVKVIAGGAFEDCSQLAGTITIPQGQTVVGSHTFDGCASISKIILPDSVTRIGDYVFYGCISLTEISLSDNLTNISSFAFTGCNSLTTIVIPSSVTSISELPFHSCSGLTNISVDDNNQYYCDVDGVLYDKNVTTLICYPASKTGMNYNVLSTVTTIEDYAFRFSTNLTSVTIPETVTSIGRNAFGDCDNLTIIDVNDSNQSYCDIDGILFDKNVTTLIKCPENNSNISVYTIPSTVKTIEEYAFEGCTNLQSITIPASVVRIGFYAFSEVDNLYSAIFEDENTSWTLDYYTSTQTISTTSLQNSSTMASTIRRNPGCTWTKNI